MSEEEAPFRYTDSLCDVNVDITHVTNKNIESMFTEIAPRYDLLNRVLSLNIDSRWRHAMVRQAGIRPGERVLDICAGTCDIPLAIAGKHPQASIVSVDFSPAMLRLAREKLARRGIEENVHLLETDAMSLPFADGSFDVVTIGFGLRNLPNYEKGIREMARVLNHGGRLLILEFKPAGSGLWGSVYQWYLKRIIPRVGGLISKSKASYDYLSTSIEGFLEPAVVDSLMEKSGLKNRKTWSLTGGICMLYRGEK